MQKDLMRTCCDEELFWCLGSASHGNVTVELLRCRRCEEVSNFTSVPSWGNAQARLVVRLQQEVVERAYGHCGAP
jgi:hypothetical protein